MSKEIKDLHTRVANEKWKMHLEDDFPVRALLDTSDLITTLQIQLTKVEALLEKLLKEKDGTKTNTD
jgi:ribosome biogenesis GTPase A